MIQLYIYTIPYVQRIVLCMLLHPDPGRLLRSGYGSLLESHTYSNWHRTRGRGMPRDILSCIYSTVPVYKCTHQLKYFVSVLSLMYEILTK